MVFERSASSSLRPTSGAAAPSRVSMGPMYERQFTGARLGANVATRDDMPPADLRTLADPLYDTERDHQPLLDRVGDARFVLLGEASHGTHDFYHERAEITKRLIIEKGFTAVAVEADWPDAYRVNRYVRGDGDDANADA